MSEGPAHSLADKLNHLFATVRPEPAREYSNEHVAATIRAAGVSISQSYIWQLRKGRKTNPTLRHIQALAEYFGVPTAYFVDDATRDRIADQLSALASEQSRIHDEAQSSDAKLMAMRAGLLSPEHRKQVMDLLDVVYRLEQAERASENEGD